MLLINRLVVSLTIILLIISIKCLTLINWLTHTIIILYLIDLNNLIIELIKRLYYLLSSTSNSLRTLYFINYFDFALK